MKVISVNKSARRNYEIVRKYESGIALVGTEVKSIKSGKINFTSSTYINFKDGEVFVVGLEIPEYTEASYNNHQTKRVKKLLLHKKEINKIRNEMKQSNLTVVPTKIYLNKRNFIKLEIALVKGLKKYDKREKNKERDTKKSIRIYY